MNIDQLGQSSAPQPSHKTTAAEATRQAPVAQHDLAPTSDQVDMSMISRLMARNLRAVADGEEIRPEKLEQFQGISRQPAQYDNATIDRILRRMQS